MRIVLWFALCGALLAAPCHGGEADAQGSPIQAATDQIKADQGAADTVWPTRQWATSTAEEQGMDSAELAKLVAFGTTHSFDSLLIARHGRIVLDAYYAPYTADIPHAINSATKSVVGTLIAIAHGDGLLDRLDHPMLDFFPNRIIANLDSRKRAITVQHLLDMTSGLDWDEGAEGGSAQSLVELGRSSNWIQFILDRPMAQAPGEAFHYDSGGTDLLSAIITRLTGRRALEFANGRLFGPLGIAPPYWRRDPQGLSIGATGLALRARDMAKLGLLYLRGGRWAGQQLLPPEWIEAISHATIDMHLKAEPGLRYANLFWALPDKHVYMAVGDHCQLIMVFPDSDLVSVVTGRNDCPLGTLADMIAGTVKSDTALPANPAAATALAKAVTGVTIEDPIELRAPSPLADLISGRTYQFPDSPLGVKMLTLYLADAQPHYKIYARDPSGVAVGIDGPIGLLGFYLRSARSSHGVRAARGSWLDDQTFAIDIQYVGTGERREWRLRFEPTKVTLSGKGSDGREVTVDAASGG